MNKAFNKKRIWRKTYGKVFITRKSIVIASMARDAVMACAEINLIMHSSTDKFLKGLAAANKVIIQAKHMANSAKIMNKGFVTK